MEKRMLIRELDKNTFIAPGNRKLRFLLILICLIPSLSFADDPIQSLMSPKPETRADGAKQILQSKDKRYVPSVMEVEFFWTLRRDREKVNEMGEILRRLTGQNPGDRYFDWIQWIGRHPEIKPMNSYLALKREILSAIDPAFSQFLTDETSIRIRPEEIVWGGVLKDGIPALVNPPHVGASEAKYLQNSDKVFGVFLNGEARAYPLRIMDWHEMVNDVLGGKPFAMPYCTLYSAAIVYDPQVGQTLHTFGSSGLLYRSNKLMYDHQTLSLWSALSGEPVAGKLVDKGISLKVLPVVRTTWGEWKERHPQTTVLSLNTGFARDYNVEPYKDYFQSSETMFPVPEEDHRLAAKEFIFALRLEKIKKAYPLDVLIKKGILMDQIGQLNVVLVTDPKGKSVRAYQCDHVQPDESWKPSEEAFDSPDGRSQCVRLPGHLAYWFGWYAQFPDTLLYKEE